MYNSQQQNADSLLLLVFPSVNLKNDEECKAPRFMPQLPLKMLIKEISDLKKAFKISPGKKRCQ